MVSADGEGLVEAEGAADGEHTLPDAQVARRADRDGRQHGGGGVDLQHREILVGGLADE